MVYLIRHPQSEANVLNISGNINGQLTKRGKWQAKKTAHRLVNLDLARILTSPALRCLYLAEAINEHHNIEIEHIFDLRERDYGELEGQRGNKIFELGTYDRPKDGESVIDVYTRAGKVYENIRLGAKTLIISHGLFLKMLAAHILDTNIEFALKKLKFSNCAISNINSNQIELLNDRSHLGPPINRIHIFGGWASRKTTLANQLARLFELPVYHLDEIKYSNGLLEERSVNERISLLEEITSKPKWITEGTWTSYALSAYSNADFLIYCDVPKEVALENAIKRQNARGYIPGASLEKLLFEINRYYDNKQEVSKSTHDDLYTTHCLNAIKSTDVKLNDLEFAEDLWMLSSRIQNT